MGLYKLTYMNGGEDTSTRKANFDSDIDAQRFAEYYNSTNQSGKITQITKIVSVMSSKKKEEFLKSNFNKNNCLDLKVMYRTVKNKLFNMTIAYLDKDYTETKIKALMSNVNEFSEIDDTTYKATKHF